MRRTAQKVIEIQRKDYLFEYATAIKKGKIKVSRNIERVYLRLLKESKGTGKSGKSVYYPELGNYVIEFIETYCRHSKGKWAGQPVRLELFQKAAIAAMFGFINKKTGKRRFKKVLFLMARKNGKSTFAAAIMLYLLIADGEGGAEIFSVATKKDQARIIFNEARNMIRQSPELAAIVKRHRTDIEFLATFSKFEPVSSDADTLDGLNAHGVAIDELHAIKGIELYEVMEQSMSAREQPLLLMTTTAGTVRESIYDERYDYAVKVAEWQEGYQDDEFLPLLYELDSVEEWRDPKAWIKANPGLGTIKSLDYMKSQVQTAIRSPRRLVGVLCKDFNMRQATAGSWITFEEAKNDATFSLEEISGCYAVGGVDLSSTTDLTCATCLIYKAETETYYVLQHYFIPGDVAEQKIKDDKVPYDLWEKRNLITYCEGGKVNFSDVTAWFIKLRDEHQIYFLWIGYDNWGSTYWLQEMKNAGFTMDVVRQGARTMSLPMKELAADLAAKKVNYNANPVTLWCLTNTTIKTDDNDNIRPVKGKNTKMRIDGTVSLLDAVVVIKEHWDDYLALAS